MSDKGIIFSAPMVRALLDGRKTQTRRLIKPQPPAQVTSAGNYSNSRVGATNQWSWLSGDPRDIDTWEFEGDFRVPYAPGDRLYVREAFSYDMLDVDRDGTLPPWYWADGNIADAERGSGNFTKPKPSIHMPRWASRLTLIVTDVRVQRVAEISEADAIAEGISVTDRQQGQAFYHDPIADFRDLWNSLHDKAGERWEDSPWVVAVSFDVKHGNIERIGP